LSTWRGKSEEQSDKVKKNKLLPANKKWGERIKMTKGVRGAPAEVSEEIVHPQRPVIFACEGIQG
jgi:hypothetical protein